MLSQFAPRDSYQAYPRWTRTRKGKQYKEDFGYGTGRSRQCLLHGPRNPLDFKIMPTSIGVLVMIWGGLQSQIPAREACSD